jgi:TPR repeat protein
MTDQKKDQKWEDIDHAQKSLQENDFRSARELLLKHFDGKSAEIANQLGYIYQNEGFVEKNLDEAIRFFSISAAAGNLYGMHALITALREKGKIEEGISWMIKASAAGSSKCSLTLHHHFSNLKNHDLAESYLAKAVEQGNALAKQRVAVRKMLGRYGIGKIAEGFREYISNTPEAIRYSKDVINK